MKNILIIISITLLYHSCKAQNIYPAYPVGAGDEPPMPVYTKDIDNDMNQLEGTWLWEDGNSSLTIEMVKLVMVPNPTIDEYDDFLVGGYRYVENGQVMVDVLPFEPNTEDVFENPIVSSVITDNRFSADFCTECGDSARYINTLLEDPTRPGISGFMYFGHFTENGLDKLRMRVGVTGWAPDLRTPEYQGPDTFSIPSGTYTLVKQD